MVLRCVGGVRGAQQRQKRACLQKADRPFSNVTSDLTDLTNEHAYVRIDWLSRNKILITDFVLKYKKNNLVITVKLYALQKL